MRQARCRHPLQCGWRSGNAAFWLVSCPAKAGIQYAAALRINHHRRRLLDRPLSRAMTTKDRAAPKPSGLIHRHTREFDHLAPFLGLVSEELAEFGGRHRLRDSADVAKPRHPPGILHGPPDCPVEEFHL